MYTTNNQYGYSSYDVELNNMRFNTLQKARQDLMGEIQAVIEYDAHIHSSSDKVAIETWQSIKSEELVHIGELLALLNYLEPNQKQFVQKGFNEFYEMHKQ